jgi:hypothetical protein
MKQLTLSLMFSLIALLSIGQNIAPWGGANNRNLQAISMGSGGNTYAEFVPPISGCGWNNIGLQTGLIREINTNTNWITPPIFNGIGNTPSFYAMQFNRQGWCFAIQSMNGCGQEVHPIYVYHPDWAMWGMPDFSDFNLTGSLCGSPNSDVTIQMNHSYPLYEYKIDVVEVNASNVVYIE